MNNSNHSPTTFTVTSPQELGEVLAQRPSGTEPAFAAVAVSGPQILARTFQFQNIPPAKTKLSLQAEAIELLSLPINEIELDYHVYNSTSEKVNGIFICLPRKSLKEYFSILDKHQVIPVKITAAILPAIETFCQEHPTTGRCCLFDFSVPQKVNFIILQDQQCEFLREIHYDNLAEAKTEIIQTLRSVSASSAVKSFDQAWCAGDLDDKAELVAAIEKHLGIKIERGDPINIDKSLSAEPGPGAIDLNLAKRFSFSLSQYKKIRMLVEKVVLCVLAGCVLLAGVNLYLYKRGREIKSSFKADEFAHAKELEKQLKGL